MQKRWLIKSAHDRTTIDQFRSEIKTDPIIAELLLQRGIDTFDKARDFFNPSIDRLHSPFDMKNMDEAIEMLTASLDGNKRVLLYGDYDVDGTTSVALMYNFLRPFAGHLEYYIPDRYTEGYGLSEQGVKYIIDEKIDLVITLDCGTKAVELIDDLSTHGIQVIICDHHTPGEKLPSAILLNPKQKECNYPFKELSGCGVAFKLLEAWCDANNMDKESLFGNLDLVAISIGADLVDVTGENRILAAVGMDVLNKQPRPAFKKMIQLAGKDFPLTLSDVVFSIAPRINAAGRISSGREAVHLMTTEDPSVIERVALQIQEYNEQRRSLDENVTLEALQLIEDDREFKNKRTTVVFKEGWHKGVVGIVASRLIEHHYRPTVVLAEAEGLLTGSARSIEGVDLYSAIDQCSDLLERYGGHKHAAGMTLKRENLNAFIRKFDECITKSTREEQFSPEITIDLEITFDQIFRDGEDRMKIPRLKRILHRFEPHGPGNMSPVFVSRNVYSTDMRILKDKHLKLSVTQPECDVVLNAIAFNLADHADTVSSGIPFDMVYTIDVNRWNGRESIQLNIKDVREA